MNIKSSPLRGSKDVSVCVSIEKARARYKASSMGTLFSVLISCKGIPRALSDFGRQSKLKRDEGASYQCNQLVTISKKGYATEPDQKQVKFFHYL